MDYDCSGFAYLLFMSCRGRKKISITRLRAQCSAVLREVEDTGRSVLITRRGKPYARIEPCAEPRKSLGALAGRIRIIGDIISPVCEPEDWEALR
jgi:prevent-host-death family protein